MLNIEFHYYAVFFLARRAGFDEDDSRLLAQSSQYVDDAIVPYAVHDGEGAPYRTITTQNYVFWDEAISSSVYLPFHFIPGDPERAARERRDREANPFIVTPDSPLARELLIDALKSGDLFRAGIALHAYADTWAHQHFSGRLEKANECDLNSPLPAAGHLQALTSPDHALGLWRDERLVPELAHVDNRERFLSAAKMIYRFLRTSRREPFDDEPFVLAELAELWRRDARDMEARIVDFRLVLGIAPYDRRNWLEDAGIADRRDDGEEEEDGLAKGYDKLLWLRYELRKRIRGGSGLRRAETGGRFAGSELMLWNEAAKAHRRKAMTLYAADGLLVPQPGTPLPEGESR
jgi:hypothetical protein